MIKNSYYTEHHLDRLQLDGLEGFPVPQAGALKFRATPGLPPTGVKVPARGLPKRFHRARTIEDVIKHCGLKVMAIAKKKFAGLNRAMRCPAKDSLSYAMRAITDKFFLKPFLFENMDITHPHFLWGSIF